MTLLSILHRPGALDFTAIDLRKQFSLEKCSSVVNITYPHGSVVVEVKDEMLAIRFPLATQLVPSVQFGVTYRRLSTTSPEFYPEILATLPGKPALLLP